MWTTTTMRRAGSGRLCRRPRRRRRHRPRLHSGALSSSLRMTATSTPRCVSSHRVAIYTGPITPPYVCACLCANSANL